MKNNNINLLLLACLSISSIVFAPPHAFAEESAPVIEEIIVTATFRETAIMDTAFSINSVDEDMLDQLSAEDLNDIYRSIPGLNLSSAGPGQNRIVVRGISGQGIYYGGGQQGSTTGIYIDDTPMSSVMGPSMSAAGDTFDLKSVEILKGPQGTLFGEASQGGTIRYLYNKPDPSAFGHKVKAKYITGDDSSDSHRVDAMVNIPLLAGSSALRLSAYTSTRGGYIDYAFGGTSKKDWNEVDMTGGKVSFLTEQESFTLELTALTAENEMNGMNTSYSAPDSDNPYLNDRTLVAPYPAGLSTFSGGLPATSTDYYVALDQFDFDGPGQDSNYDLYSMKWDFNTAWGTLTSITSYLDREVQRRDATVEEERFIVDASLGLITNSERGVLSEAAADRCWIPCNGPELAAVFGPQNPFLTNIFIAPYGDGATLSTYNVVDTGETERTIQEFRFVSDPVSDGREGFFWVAGVYYKNSDDQRTTQLPVTYYSPARQRIGQATTDNAGSPVNSVWASTQINIEQPFTEQEEFSVYGEATYNFTEHWAVTAGVRASRLEQTVSIEDPSLSLDNNDNVYAPKLNVSWSNDDHLLYLNYSTGFRQGGVNTTQLFNANNFRTANESLAALGLPSAFDAATIAYVESVTTFDDDTLTNTEAGYKGSFNDNSIQLIAAIYQQEVDDLIAWVTDFAIPSIAPLFNANVGGATSQGAEVQLIFAPLPGLTVGLHAAINESTLDDSYIGLGGTALTTEGNSLVFAPETTYGITIDYSHSLGGNLQGRLYIDYANVAEAFSDIANTYEMPDHEVVNARYSVISQAGWQVSLFVNNLTDEEIVTSFFDDSFGFGVDGRFYGRPREAGLQIQWDGT